MSWRLLALCCVLFLGMPLCARDKTDVIVMTNGDRLTCAIKALNEGTLYVSLDYVVGTISVQWSKVDHIESRQLFIVKTEDGFVYTGMLNSTSTAGRPLEIQVLESGNKQVDISREQVVQMGQTSTSFWRRFNGAVNSGINYSKGNDAIQYNFSSQLEYLRDRWSLEANYNSTLASSTGTDPSARNQLVLEGIHLLPWNNWFYSGLASFLQSSEQNIRLQTTGGGGIGRYLANTNHASIAVMGGFAGQNTNYKQSTMPVNIQNLAAAMLASEVKLFRFNKTNLTVTSVLLPALSQPGRIEFTTNATYYIKIFSNLNWNISFYGNWDNQPPAGLQGDDYGTSSGLSWTFGIR
jgi:hypothetical protein